MTVLYEEQPSVVKAVIGSHFQVLFVKQAERWFESLAC